MRSRACCIALREGQRARKVTAARPGRPGIAPADGGSPGSPLPGPRAQLHDPGLGRFRAQPEFGQQHGQPRQRGHRLPLRPAHHQRIVGVAEVGPVGAPPRPVQPVQVDVAHQRTDHPALRGARHRAPHRALFHHSRAQERAQQRQQATVTDAFLDRGHQPGVWNRAERSHDLLPASRTCPRRCGSRVRVIRCRASRYRCWAGCGDTVSRSCCWCCPTAASR